MKLIIQIPCLNEEQTLPLTLADLPRHIPGIDVIEYLVIDDGSTDRTAEVARQHGVHHLVRFTSRKGLAEAFMAGLDACLKLGADLIVNTDADNQYRGADIEKLVRPILEGRADMVIGDRQVEKIAHFSPLKIKLQKLGSWVVRHVSETSVPDATSGFRAYSREAALRMNVISRFTYTLETIIQAGKKHIALGHVQINTNGKLRESRLFTSIPDYLRRSIGTIFRIYLMYEPLKAFSWIGALVFAPGLAGALRFLYYYFTGDGGGHVQSLILSAVLMIVGFQIFMIGLLADLIAGNRRLQEDTLYRIKKLELQSLERSELAVWNGTAGARRNAMAPPALVENVVAGEG
ncbi:MAG: glycosyltransferase family 2 protein [candidate division KSB1 bacterium]|nr:glycosyltransferase family 2 protein [candidate division KSB1 bacterium]MDZ7275991.1 glycosyltransferase family 2 protein [candidate division KSB1 bacterium]MDZ7285727.1 glycosyltransferase family 2 protein [candidate division KSB1 bacterium]MDZ7298759.1 glycosyltransferase family 2 protein [candidate division KSB1 bacterium]MDZ7305942.1 glycosyltransferase family 2 protein [candidate division KSB1 bacterium]